MVILRSEPMMHGTLVLPVESARDFVDMIGADANIQLEDMNKDEMVRPYRRYIQRIDEMERILRFLTEEVGKVPGPGLKIVDKNLDSYYEAEKEYKLDEVESKLKRLHTSFSKFQENTVKLTEKRNGIIEERFVTDAAIIAMSYDQGAGQRRPAREGGEFEFVASQGLLAGEEGGSARGGAESTFSNIAGVIPQDDQQRFARTLFRATRGNTFTHFQQIAEPMMDPKSGQPVQKSVFVVYYQDSCGRSDVSAMGAKITKICGAFGVNTYEWPSSREAAEVKRESLSKHLQELTLLLDAHTNHVRSEAQMLTAMGCGGNSLIEEWRMFCVKEKSIYATLNLFEGGQRTPLLRGNCWFPASEESHISSLLMRHSSQQRGTSHALIVPDRHPRTQPPTYIRRNALTAPFQELIDTYGMPRYQEVNPMIFTVITFPFLFGIMYGDVGHGLMLLSVGLWAIVNAESLRYTVPQLYMARYMIAMMGFFAVYAGLLYNDFFSLGFNFWGSRYEHGHGGDELVPAYDVKNTGVGAGPYPFGLDPAWHGANNELLYLNSLKMKTSVIIGVAQMMLGLCLRFLNAGHERSVLDFCFECVPMMIFIVCFFGYMDFMIMYKWVTPMDNPPSIINSLICMAMFQEDKYPMFDPMIPRYLMIAAVLTVPVLLLPKPICLYIQHSRSTTTAQNNGGGGGQDEEQGRADGHGRKQAEGHHEEFNFGEIMIHQIIETIEYVLGTVSHTASYLRLWALSLAHQQLSLVFFQKTILAAMGLSFPANAAAITFAYIFWFVITVGVLLGMDVLECFLHVLRLHWVEFQSKFYRADGYAFKPYRHRELLIQE